MAGHVFELLTKLNGRRGSYVDWRKDESLQELKWKGAKTRDVGEDYKVLYCGYGTRNGVGIALSKDMCDRPVEVERINDRLMYIKLVLEDETVNLISAYVPQTTRLDFFETLGNVLQALPLNDKTIVCGDMNGLNDYRMSVTEDLAMGPETSKENGLWTLLWPMAMGGEGLELLTRLFNLMIRGEESPKKKMSS